MVNKLDKPLEVETVSEFLDHIIKGIEGQKGSNFYYRGENQYFSRRLPNFYTAQNSERLAREGSEYYYRSLINELGRSDYTDSFSLFQLLSELQHYEAKTRMLDITSNPLVALFFATDAKSNEKSDGYVYIFKEEKNTEKFDTGHTIAIKSALNLIPQDKINVFLITLGVIISELDDRGDLILRKNGKFQYYLYQSIDDLLEDASSWKDFLDYIKDSWHMLDFPIEAILKREDYAKFSDYLESLDDEFGDEKRKLLREFVKLRVDEFLELVYQRAKLKDHLRFPVKIYFDLIEAHIVLSSKRTDRLRQQQGAFIYPCFTNSNDYMSFDNIKDDIHESIMEKAGTLKIGKKEYTHIVIPEDRKEVIRKELALIGIDEGFIFPDIKHRSNALLNGESN